MKKSAKNTEPEMLEEYAFSKGVRGKYVERFKEGSNVVLFSPDVAEVFTDSESANETLRAVIKVAQKSRKIPA